MRTSFRRFEPGDEAAIGRLNERLRSAGLPHVVGGESAAGIGASPNAGPIANRMFVVTDGREIRGAVWLREQLFWSREGPVRAGWMIYPVSESLFDRRFAGVPGMLLFGLLREQPRLMALGMGGDAGPFARLLVAARWPSALVPFWFRIVRPARVLRGLPAARATPLRRGIGSALAASGLASAGHRLLEAARRPLVGRVPDPARSEPVAGFAGWADEIWERARARYGFVAQRDARSLEAIYPADFAPLARLRVRRAGRDLGWSCTQTFPAAGTWLEPHFGGLEVGILTDAFADPADAGAVTRASVEQLVETGVDLVVAHFSHPAWCQAVRRLGFWQGPSNLAFSWSPAAGALLDGSRSCHLTRSDCDGPQSA